MPEREATAVETLRATDPAARGSAVACLTQEDVDAAQYWLTPHVSVAVTSDHRVLLDLARDRYWGVTTTQARVLSKHVADWHLLERPTTKAEQALQASGYTPAFEAKTLAHFERNGILTRDRSCGIRATEARVQIESPVASLLDVDIAYRPTVRVLHVIQFYRSIITARIWLANRALTDVVALVQTKPPSNNGVRAELDIEKARDLVQVFRYLRPLLFAGPDRCKLDSVSLIIFLRHHGIYPSWVWGVQTQPWHAHCWVQYGHLVMNDSVEHARRYTPILTVR